MSNDPVLLRQMVPGDLPYVFSTLLRDLRDADPSGLPDDLWFPPHRAFIERVLADPRTVALVLAASDQPTEILAYGIATGDVLEWVHVRKPLRRKGLAKRLMASTQCSDPATSRWSTPDSRKHLRLLQRSRQLRRSTEPRSPSSTPSSARRRS